MALLKERQARLDLAAGFRAPPVAPAAIRQSGVRGRPQVQHDPSTPHVARLRAEEITSGRRDELSAEVETITRAHLIDQANLKRAKNRNELTPSPRGHDKIY